MVTTAGVTSLLTSLANVRRSCSDQLTCTDRTRLNLWIEKLQELACIPERNGHYIICPWSHDGATEGPDTCVCHVPAKIELKFHRILEDYDIAIL